IHSPLADDAAAAAGGGTDCRGGDGPPPGLARTSTASASGGSRVVVRACQLLYVACSRAAYSRAQRLEPLSTEPSCVPVPCAPFRAPKRTRSGYFESRTPGDAESPTPWISPPRSQRPGNFTEVSAIASALSTARGQSSARATDRPWQAGWSLT